MNSNKNVINFFDKNIYLCLALSMCGILKTAKYRKEKVMGNEAGEWIIHGVTWDDPKCIHDVDEAVEYINRVGFLPLFKNEIPGFSLEERTVAEYWWSDDPVRDPWRWRIAIAKRHDVLYGKFFAKKAGLFQKNGCRYLPTTAGTAMILMLCLRMKKHRSNIRILWIILWKMMQKSTPTN